VEVVFKVDPDKFSGTFEWEVVAASAVLTVAFGFLSVREVLRTRSQAN
jgi:hypothetical protein